MMLNDMINEINKKMSKLETEYHHALVIEWKKSFVTYAIQKLEEGSVSKETFRTYETFLENCVDDVRFFYPVYEQAMIVAQHMQSSWSGGHSVSNMLEYIQRNVATNFTCKRVLPFNYWHDIYDDICEKIAEMDWTKKV